MDMLFSLWYIVVCSDCGGWRLWLWVVLVVPMAVEEVVGLVVVVAIGWMVVWLVLMPCLFIIFFNVLYAKIEDGMLGVLLSKLLK